MRELVATNGRPGVQSPYDSILSGIELWNEMDPNHEFSAFTSLAQVRRFLEQADVVHRQYLAACETEAQRIEEARKARREIERERAAQKRRAVRAVDRIQFAPPPIPGTEDIVPITSLDELRHEGHEQQNCVGIYYARVLSGEFYAYRVLRPERATLMLIYCDDGCWLRNQLETRGNTRVQPATAAHVDAWLSAHRLSI